MINIALVNGRITKDIELKYTQGGQAIANFTIACDKGMSKAKKDEAVAQNKPTTDFINVVCFSHTAEYVAKYLKKGKLASVSGRINTGSYEDKEGRRIYTTDILANNVDIMEWENNTQTNDNSLKNFQPVDTGDIPF